nr:immunoglobulin light chain junction region [Macaca mulatta]MOX81565.1 immunoglobulin light chain junction region [Macaca mulatta]MOX82836.1 immunoglobulin light chain junction region [Macaca mulatta]MOX83827.1 immunoglobulin light chain junction region [Macaca mulatta]
DYYCTIWHNNAWVF